MFYKGKMNFMILHIILNFPHYLLKYIDNFYTDLYIISQILQYKKIIFYYNLFFGL